MLFPSVDFDLMLFTTEMGHERPKHISIIVSNVVAIFFLLFFFTCSVILLKNMNVKYIIVIKSITFGYELRKAYGTGKTQIFLCGGKA